jgi:hypothetical protein
MVNPMLEYCPIVSGIFAYNKRKMIMIDYIKNFKNKLIFSSENDSIFYATIINYNNDFFENGDQKTQIIIFQENQTLF